MKTREQIITAMCYTYRHDYGLEKHDAPNDYHLPFSSGMRQEERLTLWNQMSQIFDNDIAPYMEFKHD